MLAKALSTMRGAFSAAKVPLKVPFGRNGQPELPRKCHVPLCLLGRGGRSHPDNGDPLEWTPERVEILAVDLLLPRLRAFA